MTVVLTPRVFGTKKLYSKQPTAFSKSSLAKGDRTADSVANDHIAMHYANCHIHRTAEGTYSAHDMTDGMELQEEFHASSTGYKTLPDGSHDRTITGNYRSQCKGGETRSGQGPHDEAIHGHGRRNTGHDKSKINAGIFHAHNGHELHFRAGQHIGGATGLNSSGYHLGKFTENSEGGIGHGVNKGGTKYVYQRMYGPKDSNPAGTYHVQVMPPGEEGGQVTLKFKPDGTILITSASTQNTVNGGTHTIKAPKIVLDGPVHITGAVTTDSHIKSKGFHKAPIFVGPDDDG